jgi:ABC-type nitrate/sulfonate/bicarbonate transport system permease component
MTTAETGSRFEPRPPDDVAAEPSARPGFLYRRSGMLITQFLTLVLILLVWEWYASDKSIALIAPPTKIAQSAYNLVIQNQDLVFALAGSVSTMAVGMTLAILIGIPLGVLMGRSKTFESVLDPYVMFLYVLPSVAFIPVLVVIIGIDVKLRLAMIFLSAVFPLMINTIAGVKNVDSELVDSGRSFCASEFQIMRTIILPASVPFIFAGIRIGFSAAWVGAIVAEMTAIITGVGGLLLESASRFKTADVFVAIFGIMIVAVAIQVVTSYIERRLTPWRRAYEAEQH